MGLLTETERKDFESLCLQYPEVAQARTAFEQSLESQLLADATLPPQQLKQQVFDRLGSTGNESKVIEIEDERTPVKRMGVWKWVAAASVLLMAATAYWAFDRDRQYKNLEAKNQQLENQLKQSTDQLALIQTGAASPKSDFKMAAIKTGEASATVYWDTLSKDVYLMVNNMPQPASDRQYQLWALLPDEGSAPLDLGMIELKQERLLYRMKNVQNAKAFAITVEPKGGSKTPTSEPMVSTSPLSL